MKSGERINGVALDTKRNDQKQECIEVKIDETKQLVILEDISKLTVSVKNPHFSEVTFQ
ncbi:Rho-specific inhibitor of transcription termination [Vibrio maritimus]|uniref:Rho-specific inhibitor of transcription termination n=2 Tax=Vibrio maritimus TaxID=990268 RepID=A0A090RUF4_9VIBR|nr:Rho-specific inhibitor of transcription termination [Vibrio maritimus]